MAYTKISIGKRALRAELANTTLKCMRGLMFRRRAPEALLFVLPHESVFHSTLHSLFVFFRFDAVWLDGSKRVVDKRSNVRPFLPHIAPAKPARYVVELPAGQVNKLKIRKGALIRF